MIYLILFIVTLVILCGVHFFPFAQLFGKDKLPRLIAYAIGLGIILAIFTTCEILAERYDSVYNLWAISIGAGVGTGIGYWISCDLDRNRALKTKKIQNKEYKQANDLLMEMRDEPAEGS
jgi:membrane protein DedA with SNARE-associated domain